MMEVFRGSRDVQITRDPPPFAELHEKHYDELLSKIIELAARLTPPPSPPIGTPGSPFMKIPEE
jgi:hypothetical protein